MSEVNWPIEQLNEAPGLRLAREFHDADVPEGVMACFFTNVPWKGKDTECFAWVGLPANASAEQQVPGVVLVHGGGGTAEHEWVKRWMDRGYAAIALDHCGCTYGGEHASRPRHETGGPQGCGGFDAIDDPVADQWMYHAVSGVIRAKTLLGMLPEVNAEKIGVMGISWGGVVMLNTLGVDHDFKFAISVYGCGYLGGGNGWPEFLMESDHQKAQQWLRNWDPSHRLDEITTPILFATGTRDFAFSPSAHQATIQAINAPVRLSYRSHYPHSPGHAYGVSEAYAFADSVLFGQPDFPTIGEPMIDQDQFTVAYRMEDGIPEQALLVYTRDNGSWREREWESMNATLNPLMMMVQAPVPEGVMAALFVFKDQHGLRYSSEIISFGMNGYIPETELVFDANRWGDPEDENAGSGSSSGIAGYKAVDNTGSLGDVVA